MAYEPGETRIFQPETPRKRYSFGGVLMIAYSALILLLCVFLGLGIFVSELQGQELSGELRPGSVPSRILIGILGSVVCVSPVIAFFRRGAWGWILALSCNYFLLFVMDGMVFTQPVFILPAAIIVGGVAALHHVAVRQFYRNPQVTLRQHLIAAGIALFAVCIIGLSFAVRAAPSITMFSKEHFDDQRR